MQKDEQTQKNESWKPKNWDRAPMSLEKIQNLVLDWQLYPRKEIDITVAEKYAAALQAGANFPPVKIGICHDKAYRLADKKIIVDGEHRIRSRQLLKMQYIECLILPFQNEAELFKEAVYWNSSHGKGYSEVDMKINIRRLKRYKVSASDIVAICRIPLSKIINQATRPITTMTSPSGKTIACSMRESQHCDGQPTAYELREFRKALILMRNVARKGCIPSNNEFKDLVKECREALEKVQFNA